MPAVSVVVIGYNDADNLVHAVESVTRQTLRDLEVVVVDDASTDDTPAVTARLAAADRRVRVVRLPENSGGCSRPRNVGLEHATGDYVTFLDSDDVLSRRGCERMLAAAKRYDADLVCGRYVRRHTHPRRVVPSHDLLYLRPALVESVLERPRQLRDALCVGKLYRRRFLDDQAIRFPEGLLYEDLLFTTQAYCTAKRIAVIPDLVYVWNVRRDAAEPSISNRREVRNWQDRFEVNRRIDAYLADHHASPEMRAAKDSKFLASDMPHFLRQLRQFPPDARPELLALAASYVETLDLTHVPDAHIGGRVGAFLTARHDLPRVLAAADYTANGGVATDLHREDGRLLWTAAHRDAPGAAIALDVTETGWATATFAATPFLVVVEAATVDGHRLLVTGVVRDLLDRLGTAAALTASLELAGRVGGAFWHTSVELAPDEESVRFSATVDLAAVGRRLLRPTIGHELRLSLVLRRGGETARRPLSARDADLPDHDIPLPTPWRAVAGDRVRLAEVNGRVVLALGGLPATVDAVINAASLARNTLRRARLRRKPRADAE